MVDHFGIRVVRKSGKIRIPAEGERLGIRAYNGALWKNGNITTNGKK